MPSTGASAPSRPRSASTTTPCTTRSSATGSCGGGPGCAQVRSPHKGLPSPPPGTRPHPCAPPACTPCCASGALPGLPSRSAATCGPSVRLRGPRPTCVWRRCPASRPKSTGETSARFPSVGARRILSCFVLVLSWSRAVYARFALDQTLESFLRGHVEAFTALGGVPRTLLYDNLKSVVLERVGDHIRFHPRLLELAGHYHFAPQPCAPYRGNEKGKVERMIQYLRHSFFAAHRFASLNDLNAQLATWIAETAHARSVPGTAGRVVREAWAAEQPRLLPLPEHAFVCDLVRPVVSGKTPYIRFDGNDYSIPHTLVRRPLTLVASETALWLLDSATEVARHPRSYAHGQRVEEPAHLALLAREKRRAHDLRGRDRLRQACPQAERFFDALAQRGAPLASQTAALLRLLDEYGTAALDAALATALARGAINTASVAHLLDQRARARRQPPPLAVVLPADPRVRDLRVTPHALTA